MRRWGALVGVVGLAAGCGSHSATSPTPSQPSTAQPSAGGPVLDLTSGTYQFTLTMSTSADGGASLCIATNGATPDLTPTAANVALDRAGNTIVVHATDPSSTLRMDLRLSNGTLSGTASGDYGSDGRVVGKLSGEMLIDGSGCANNNHSWTLTPR